jgi:hypothetical protein
MQIKKSCGLFQLGNDNCLKNWDWKNDSTLMVMANDGS